MSEGTANNVNEEMAKSYMASWHERDTVSVREDGLSEIFPQNGACNATIEKPSSKGEDTCTSRSSVQGNKLEI